ncbi:hypothetical protein [Halalkalibacter okhensis]|uniref:Uncharacterized protein n=1 Tax=Halalkalibacter okhensis TaxID=333138 RepID=A0A0B0I813_9BACI|nr:hypothetical protein [Halalkalibacter okhensis]KHF38638.1 hypothetical protein LQ50_20200 [Halalkalibacter okhensis]
MQIFQIVDIENKVKEYLEEEEDYNLCPYGIKANNKLYFYGHIEEKGFFVIDKEGIFMSRNEIIPVFKDFVQSWTILTDNYKHFEYCATKRSLSSFEKLKFNMENFQYKFKWKIRELEDEISNVNHMLSAIFNGQNQLKEKIKDVQTFKSEKFEEKLYLEEEEINQLISLNSEMNWILYQQAQSIDNAFDSLGQIYSFITKEFTFREKYLNFTIIALTKLIEHFTSAKTIQQNKESLKTFEENHNGNYIGFPQGETGFHMFNKNMQNKFNADFTSIYIPKLINK